MCSSSDASMMMGTVSLRARKDGRYEPANAASIVLNALVYVTSHPRSNMKTSLLLALSAVAGSSVSVTAFVPSTGGQKVSQSYQTQLGIFGKFFEELDAFVDDATNRRLGNGAAFYGKRKSTFYGEQDFMKKDDKDVEDPTGEYLSQQSFSSSSLFHSKFEVFSSL